MKMKTEQIKILAVAAVAAALSCVSGCTSQSLETTYASLEDAIDRYITTNFSDSSAYTVHRYSGSNRITVLLADSLGFVMPEDTLMAGGTVTFDYALYLFDSSFPPRNMIAATTEELATQGGVWGDESVFVPATVNLSDKQLLEGLRKGLMGVYAGEECYILFSPKYGFGNTEINAIPKMSSLIYHVWVLDIEN